MSKEEVAKRKREAMGRRRSADIESARAYARKHYANNRDKMKEKLRKAYHSDMFKSRAAKLRADGHATGADLRKKWEEQDGLCALTGRILDKTAQVDHIIPKSKGGGDGIDNVRWVHKDANLAKRGLTDLELLELCHDVIRWLGQRIEATR